jgi:hypothetical protein
MDKNRMEQENGITDFFDFEFNYAVVIFGKLYQLQRIKSLLQREPGITIRYQTLDRGRLLIKREGKE